MFYKVVKVFEVLASKIRIFEYIYFGLCKGLVEKEIKEANITSGDKVLHIGCGSLPYTALIISQKTKARVVAIDNDPRAVKQASYYIKSKNNTVKVMHGDGKNFSVKEFDVILVSHGVIPKEIILRNIYASMKNQRLIFRNPKGIVGRIYNKEMVDDFIGAKRIKQKKYTFRESVLVIK